MSENDFKNPFRPGAGHPPPFLAGREAEKDEFRRLLQQDVILENMILTGLRGVGKTVLLDTLKPIALQEGCLWVGTDLSESTSIDEEKICLRLLTDLSPVTAGLTVGKQEVRGIGFDKQTRYLDRRLNFDTLRRVFVATPGLPSDKLKAVLELVWRCMQPHHRLLVFAYDEAQTLSDHAAKEQYPLSLLLDVFQSIQRKRVPFMLALAGLPTLFPQLVQARTYSERMFRIVFLDRLDHRASRQAITRPIRNDGCPISLDASSIEKIIELSAGYPYFIQFICREVFDAFIQRMRRGERAQVPLAEITRKLDSDFFAGRWARATDRQRELLSVIARLDNCDDEFSVKEVVDLSRKTLDRPFSASHVSQMLVTLGKAGLVYKNRHGRYSFAVPLLGRFIRRQTSVQEKLSL